MAKNYRVGANRSANGRLSSFKVIPSVHCKWDYKSEPLIKKPPKPLPRKGGKKRLSDDQVRKIRAAWDKLGGLMVKNNFCIAQGVMHGCSPLVVRNIIEGLNYKGVV